jgi:hypothetical protein
MKKKITSLIEKVSGKFSLFLWRNFRIHEIAYNNGKFKHIRFKKKQSVYFEIGKKSIDKCYKIFELGLCRIGLRY